MAEPSKAGASDADFHTSQHSTPNAHVRNNPQTQNRTKEEENGACNNEQKEDDNKEAETNQHVNFDYITHDNTTNDETISVNKETNFDTKSDGSPKRNGDIYNSSSNRRETGLEEENNKDPSDVLEDALSQLGHFGLYQCYVLLMLCIPNLFAAMYSLNYVFVADQVPFRCIVPECEGDSQPYFGNATVAELLPSATQCRRYEPLHEHLISCERDHYHPNDTIECDAFIYQNVETTFAEFGMACREWLRTLVGTVRNSALPFALILTGYISDQWGRRTAFCTFSACAGALGIIKGFSVNYHMYVVMEFLEAALGYGFNSAGYVMMVELARPSLRASFACATGVAYGLGGVLFAFIAWKVPYWRHLLWTIHAPALLLPFYRLLVDESARWLHVKGRAEDTERVIRKAARWNKVTLDEELMHSLEQDTTKTNEKQEGNPWLNLLRSRVLMGRFAACSWCWIAATFVYYGLTINSVSLSGDKHANFALNMAMEIVASLLIMMALERFGRKRSIFVAYLLCGVACVTPYFISHTGTGLGLFFLGKLAITFAFNSMYVFTAELFPTRARSSALAACSLVGRVGSILAPQTPLLNLYVQALLYGMVSLAAALAVLAVPETRHARLPHDVLDAERVRRERDTPPPPPAPPRTPVVLSAYT